jgi:hypothetical protein
MSADFNGATYPEDLLSWLGDLDCTSFIARSEAVRVGLLMYNC